MKIREEYRNEPPPDDPIEFHVWVEANECHECEGTGIDLDALAEMELEDSAEDEELPDCEHCEGTGFTEAARPYV